MRNQSFLHVLLIGVLMMLVACTPQEEPLPTVSDINAISSATALYILENPPTATSTPLRAELPPTFTPTPTEIPSLTPLPSITPRSTGNAQGAIYYIYNGDSIAVATLDGLTNDILITSGVGIPITSLILAPNGESFAYIAPSGNANEIFISDLTATTTQRITCLGYQYIKDVTWSPDSQSLVFFGAPALNAPLNIYTATIAGSANCPAGNQQRRFIELNAVETGGLTWNANANYLFYGLENSFFLYDTTTQISTRYNYGTTPDFIVTHSPTLDRLALLESAIDSDTGRTGGALVIFDDTTFIPQNPRLGRGTLYNATDLAWSPDGTRLLIITPERLIVVTSNTLSDVSDVPLTNPRATFSPDNRFIAYSTFDVTSQADQIFIYDVQTQRTTQLTNHPIGTVNAIIWAEAEL